MLFLPDFDGRIQLLFGIEKNRLSFVSAGSVPDLAVAVRRGGAGEREPIIETDRASGRDQGTQHQR